MNLNVSDYTDNELLELINVSSDNMDILSIKGNIIKLVHRLNKDHSESDENKDKIIHFLLEAFKKICFQHRLHYTTQDIDEIQNIFKVDQVVDIHNRVVQKRDKILEEVAHSNPHVFPQKYRYGDINQLNKQSRKLILNVNTRFRKDYEKTDSTNYTLTLPNPIRNVLSLRLVSSEIPSVVYTFSSKLKTNEFTIQTYTMDEGVKTGEEIHVIRILNGYYSSSQLQEYLNTYIFKGSGLEHVECEIDEFTGKFIFRKTESAPASFQFDLDFRIQENQKRSIQLNMGWIMGYRKSVYTFAEDYHLVSLEDNPLSIKGFVPESTYDLGFTKYFLLHLNDFNKNHSVIFESPFQEGLLNSSEVIAKIPNMASANTEVYEYAYMFDDNSGHTHKTREYYGPVNIEKLEIRLLDEFGRPVDLNHNDYSFSLELDIVYDL